MNKEFSDLIRSLRLIMVIGLVFVHFGNFPGHSLDPFIGVVNTDLFYASSFNSFFTYFFLCSVPVLSMISGYLFSYRGIEPYTSTLKKKSKTLILPSITWTSLWLVAAFSLYAIGKDAGQFTYYDQGFEDYSILDLLNGIVGITQTPFAFQFWFVHDLVLSLIFSPVLIFLIRKLGKIFVLLPFALWGLEIPSAILFNYKVIAFFILGLYAGITGFQPKIPTKLGIYNLSIGIFILMVLGRIYIPRFYEGSMPFETLYELALRAVGSLAIISIALNIRLHVNSLYKILVNKSGYAFYLHASHFPLVILVKQALSMTGLFEGELDLCLLWISTIVITITIALGSAEVLHKIAAPVYRFLNGQRSI